jgi:hypothetical protein
MSQNEFNHLLSSLGALSPEQLARLRRELDNTMESPRPAVTNQAGTPAEETVFDVLDRAGLIGCLKGMPGTPTDLSTNRKHMEGFGCG